MDGQKLIYKIPIFITARGHNDNVFNKNKEALKFSYVFIRRQNMTDQTFIISDNKDMLQYALELGFKNVIHYPCNSDLDILKSKIAFIKGVTQNEIIISKKKKDEIIKQLEKIQGIIKVNDSFDYLLKLPLYSLTAEKILELEKQLKETKDSLKELKETSIEILWTKDIEEL